MLGKKLCTTCKTGRETLKLDERSFVCPYLYMYHDGECGRYVEDTLKPILRIKKSTISIP